MTVANSSVLATEFETQRRKGVIIQDIHAGLGY